MWSRLRRPARDPEVIGVGAQLQIGYTCNVARLVGLEAAKRKVKSYVRLQMPWYECSEKGTHDEKENPKPLGVLGTWWHETLRILGAIEGQVPSSTLLSVMDPGADSCLRHPA